MLRYKLKEEGLKLALKKKGFHAISELAKVTGFNRATLNSYLKGRGPLSEPYYELCSLLDKDPLQLLTPYRVDLKIEFTDEIIPIVQDIANKYPDVAVMLLGSRAKGKEKKYSDWDLGVTKGSKGLTTKEYFAVKSFVEDIVDDLPRSVDVVNLDNAPLWFLEGIDYDPIYLGGKQGAFEFFLGVLNGIKKE